LTLANRLVRDEQLFGRGDRVLCACSGGPDSTALLDVLALLRARLGHELWAVGVNHGLRAEADQELDVAREVAARHEVPFRKVRVRLEAGANLQARARDARHGALQRVARQLGAAVVAIGHTADDRAETVAMRLLAGAGPRGLGVLPPRSSPAAARGWAGADLVRPLVGARRADVMAHLARRELPHSEDPSNRDLRFLRVRVRRQLMPLLEALSPGIVGHFCALADMMRRLGQGDPLASLTRAQRLALERALELRQGRTAIRLPGGQELELRFRRLAPGAKRKK